MPTTITVMPNRCQHIFNPDSDLARRCGSPALRGEVHCYYHHPSRKPSVTRHSRKGFDIMLPQDRASLQYSLHQVIHRLAANEIDTHRASLLLYSLQLAGRHLR